MTVVNRVGVELRLEAWTAVTSSLSEGFELRPWV